MTQKPDPDPSPERQFVQKWIVQPLIQWTPLTASGFLFVRFLLEQEWFLTLPTFIVTVVSSVWVAYSKNFIDQLSAIYAERGKSDANKLVVWMDSLDQALKWQFSGFEGKYLRQQSKLCKEYSTEGFNPDHTAIPMLEEVFVPLELGEQVLLNTNTVTIWELLKRSRRDRMFRQMALQAKGGFGKTTLMRHIALIYGEGKQHRYHAPKLIPFLLYLRDWRSFLTHEESIPSLPELLTKHYIPSLSKNQPLLSPPKWVDRVLRQGKALIMFDGFDEVPEDRRQGVSCWISQQMQEYNESTFIITSRPAGYKDYVAKRPTVPLFVQKLNLDQQKSFVKRWYFCQERVARSEKQITQAREAATDRSQNLLAQLHDPSRSELREMAENPLLLNMLATFHRFDPGAELPRRRHELYKGICKLQLEDRPRARGISMLLSYEDNSSVLQSLAISMVKANRPTVDHEPLLAFLSKHPILKQENVDCGSFLKQMVQVSELLVERESGQYEFPHLSFQGYFAATHLVMQKDKGATVALQNWDKAWWRESLLLYAAQLSPQAFNNVIEQTYRLSQEAATLAGECLLQYRKPEQIDPNLQNRIENLTKNVRAFSYQQLETYLKNGQWQEADQETYRLMITTVGKEEGQWFNRDELLNFPCEDLRAIDKLWVDYSKGHFGFSVQKKIYVECGATLDGRYPGDRIWYNFGDRVGWFVTGNSLSYSQLTFSTSSKKGHLRKEGTPPSSGGVWAWF